MLAEPVCGNMEFDIRGRLDFESPDMIRSEQTRLLNEHLAYCRAKSPYYRRILSGRTDRPVTIESLAELPLTGKTDLSEFNDLFVALPPEEIADISFTSGTTGYKDNFIKPIFNSRINRIIHYKFTIRSNWI